MKFHYSSWEVRRWHSMNFERFYDIYLWFYDCTFLKCSLIAVTMFDEWMKIQIGSANKWLRKKHAYLIIQNGRDTYTLLLVNTAHLKLCAVLRKTIGIAAEGRSKLTNDWPFQHCWIFFTLFVMRHMTEVKEERMGDSYGVCFERNHRMRDEIWTIHFFKH